MYVCVCVHVACTCACVHVACTCTCVSMLHVRACVFMLHVCVFILHVGVFVFMLHVRVFVFMLHVRVFMLHVCVRVFMVHVCVRVFMLCCTCACVHVVRVLVFMDYNRIKQKEMGLPQAVLAFKLLDTNKITHRDRQLVLTAVNYMEKETLFDQMKSSLRKFHGEQSVK